MRTKVWILILLLILGCAGQRDNSDCVEPGPTWETFSVSSRWWVCNRPERLVTLDIENYDSFDFGSVGDPRKLPEGVTQDAHCESFVATNPTAFYADGFETDFTVGINVLPVADDKPWESRIAVFQEEIFIQANAPLILDVDGYTLASGGLIAGFSHEVAIHITEWPNDQLIYRESAVGRFDDRPELLIGPSRIRLPQGRAYQIRIQAMVDGDPMNTSANVQTNGTFSITVTPDDFETCN